MIKEKNVKLETHSFQLEFRNLGLFRTARLKQRNYTLEIDGIFLAVMLTLKSVEHAIGENCTIEWILKRPFYHFGATSSAANNKCYPRESKAFNCAVKSFTHEGINLSRVLWTCMSTGTVRYRKYSRNIPCWAPIRLTTSRSPPCFICRKGADVTGRGVPLRCVHWFASASGLDAKTYKDKIEYLRFYYNHDNFLFSVWTKPKILLMYY